MIQTQKHSCIVDNWKQPFLPLVDALIRYPMLKNIITAIDSLYIDICILLFAFLFIYKGMNSLPFLVSIFYLTRSFTIYKSGQWPKPNPYLFEYPGFPSLFISYRPSNDLYFSGHIGITTMMTVVNVRWRHSKRTILCVCGVVLTWMTLLLTGGHYSNDLLIGQIYAILTCVWSFKIMDIVTFYALRFYVYMMSKTDEFIYHSLSMLNWQSKNQPEKDKEVKIDH